MLPFCQTAVALILYLQSFGGAIRRFDELPEFRIFLQHFVFASGKAGAEEKVFEGVAVQNPVHNEAEGMAFKINAIIAEPEAMERFAVALEFAEMFHLSVQDLLGEAAEFAEDIELQFLRHLGEFGGAGGIKNDLELHLGCVVW